MRKQKQKQMKVTKLLPEQVLAHAETAKANHCPLCDDTGIPHLVLEIGEKCAITELMLDAIKEGVAEGLRKLPGRPTCCFKPRIATVELGE